MKAVAFSRSLAVDHPEALKDITLDVPKAKGHDLLVEVKAISVNPVDYKVRQRMAPPEGEWKVLGWDAAGIVNAVGEDVEHFKPGDQVYYAGDLTRPGSNAEYQLVDERIVGTKPQTLSFAEAAALPLTTITAWELCFDRLNIPLQKEQTDQSILIIGAAGGVGSIMVQLLRQLTGITVIGTASREVSVNWLAELGAHQIINHRDSLSKELELIGHSDVDYVASLTNTAEHYDEIIKCLKPQGKLGVIDDAEHLDAMPLKIKSISLHWEFMFARSMFKTVDMIEQHHLLCAVSDLIDQGIIKTTVAHQLGTINAKNVIKAHTMLEQQQAHGKIVLEGF